MELEKTHASSAEGQKSVEKGDAARVKGNSSLYLDAPSFQPINGPLKGYHKKEDSSKSIIERALDGTINENDYKLKITDFVRKQNVECGAKISIALSKNSLDFNAGSVLGNVCSVCKFNDQSVFSTDTLRITNKHAKKKFYFYIAWNPNPKFELTVTPNCGEIKKGKSVDLQFKLRVFVTTKVYQMVKIIFSTEALNPETHRMKFFRRSIVSKEKSLSSFSALPSKDDPYTSAYVNFRVESELSASIDYDELELHEQIAKGGFGTVYRASWRGSEVAVKILNSQDMVEDEMEMIQREIALMSKLNYSYIVTYMGSTVLREQPLALVMEYIKGGSLAKLLKKTLDDRFKCKLALDTAKGMAFLHSHNINHRDLKPDNMLVVSSHPDTDINLKITDFGTSKAAAKHTQAIEAYQAFNPKDLENQTREERQLTKGVGTLVYQAPEILEGRVDIQVDKTDIYSFGVLLWEVWTQVEPFSQPPYDTLNAWGIVDFVREGKRLEIPKEVNPKIVHLIKKCWNQDPQERPSFQSIVKTLEGIYETLPKPALATNTIPIPPGDPTLFCWCEEISRVEAEEKLKNSPSGTFLTRWSRNTNSYVISYVHGKAFEHIAHIIPSSDKSVVVVRKDGNKDHYKSLLEYINNMIENKIISKPLSLASLVSEDLYGFSPPV